MLYSSPFVYDDSLKPTCGYCNCEIVPTSFFKECLPVKETHTLQVYKHIIHTDFVNFRPFVSKVLCSPKWAVFSHMETSFLHFLFIFFISCSFFSESFLYIYFDYNQITIERHNDLSFVFLNVNDFNRIFCEHL